MPSMKTTQPSHVQGDRTAPLLQDTIGSLLDRIAVAHPARPALVVRSQGVRMSYREFHAEVERVAAGLLRLGLARGERIGIWSP
ncbi:MAG TPA: AMP-binding protein, partial [Rhodanobacter sp.]